MHVNVLIGCLDPGRWHDLNAMLQREVLNEQPFASQTVHLSDALCRAGQSRPEVLLLEYIEGPAGTLHLLSALRPVAPSTRTLVLHEGITAQQTIALIKGGASGALLKSGDQGLICKAVRAVHEGQIWFSRIALVQAIRHLLDGEPVEPLARDESLTHREKEILRCVGLGLSNKEIARQLDISDHTVKTHLHRIYVKLNLSGRYKAHMALPTLPTSPMPIQVRSRQPPEGT